MTHSTRRSMLQAAAAWSLYPSLGRAATQSNSSPTSAISKIPKLSDVVFSTRFFRPDSVDKLKDFKATRCEWLYTDDKSVVNLLHRTVSHVGLSVRSNPTTPNSSGSALNIDGKPVIAPWQQKMGYEWASSLRKPTQTAILNWIDKNIEIGADSIQIDDPNMQYGASIFSGGDFSKEALNAFSIYAKNHAAGNIIAELEPEDWDMAKWIRSKTAEKEINWPAFKIKNESNQIWQLWQSFLQLSTQTFLTEIKNSINSSANPVPLSFNVEPFPGKNNTFLMEIPDYWISEVDSQQSPIRIAIFAATAAAFEKPLITSMAPTNFRSLRWQIATTYANGILPLAPWDIFVPQPNGDSSRFFGSAADYADLYAFVRQNPSYFDSAKNIAGVSIAIDPKKASRNEIFTAATQVKAQGYSFNFIIRESGKYYGAKNIGDFVLSLGVANSEIFQLNPNAKIINYGSALSDNLPLISLKEENENSIIWSIRQNDKSLFIHVINDFSQKSPRHTNNSGMAMLTVPNNSTAPFLLDNFQVLTTLGSRALSARPINSADFTSISLPLNNSVDWQIFRLSKR